MFKRFVCTVMAATFLVSSVGATSMATAQSAPTVPIVPSQPIVQLVAPAHPLLSVSDLPELPAQDAESIEGGLPWALWTTIIGSAGAAGVYLAKVYLYKTETFNWQKFAQAGGCGALGGAIWGFGGGWAGRNVLRYALVSFGATAVVTGCSLW